LYKHKKIEVPLYHCYLHVHFADDLSILEKKLSIKPQEGFNYEHFEAVAFEIYKDGTQHVHVAFEGKELYPDVVAHESKHAVNMIFKGAFIELDVHNDEPECYLLSWIVKQVYHVHGNTKT